MVKASTPKSRGADGKRAAKKKIDFRTKKTAIGSKRKLARFGKRQTTGHVGASTHYISRTKALRTLQITLKDFRRLCILKGIYPRDPTKKPEGKQSTTYYSVKDIAFLHHEPILTKFREMKSVSKRIARSLGRKETSEAQRLFKSRPKYTLDHLVKERYPTFSLALNDLDDGLSLIHLFASLPGSLASKEHSLKCAKLAREWQYFVSKSQCLRKAFVSMKGLYYQVEVQGTPITWMVPHKFAQNVGQLKANKEIDFRVMKTFLEFYETLLEFVMFKLYREGLNLAYPPVLDREVDERGEYLNALKATSVSNAATKESESKRQRLDTGLSKTLSETASLSVTKTKVFSQKKKPAQTEEEESSDSEEEEEEVGKDFVEESEEMKAIHERSLELQRTGNLFKGFHFFLGREVPLDSLEFCILSFGGLVTREDLVKPSLDLSTVTHQVVDRSTPVQQQVGNREYVQPQWVYDCINTKLLLPVREYAPEVENLPPHLSPFVDDELEGYKPARAEEIEVLRKARAGGGGTEALLKKLNPDALLDDDESDSSSEEEDNEAVLENRIEVSDKVEEVDEKEEEEDREDQDDDEEEVVIPETLKAFYPVASFQGPRPGYFFRRGDQGVGYYQDASILSTFNAAKEAKEHDKTVKKAEVTEAKEMRTIMMSNKAKHLYGRMQHGIAQKKETIAKLERKRKE